MRALRIIVYGAGMGLAWQLLRWTIGWMGMPTWLPRLPELFPEGDWSGQFGHVELGQLAETKMINCLSAACGLSDALRARPM